MCLQLATSQRIATGGSGDCPGVFGHMAPYDSVAFDQSMLENGRFTCAIPLAWANLVFSPMPGVRMSRANLDATIEDQMKLPLAQLRIPNMLVGLLDGQKPDSANGDLLVLSPEEDRIPILVVVTNHIKRGLPDEERGILKKLLYCVQTAFIRTTNEDPRYFAAIRERRNFQERAMRIKRSGVQVVDEIICFWNRKQHSQGKMRAEAIFQAFHSNCGGEDCKDADPSLNVTKISSMMQLRYTKNY